MRARVYCNDNENESSFRLTFVNLLMFRNNFIFPRNAYLKVNKNIVYETKF